MIIGYPTESFFALGVPATDAKAIQQLFHVKHREQNKPVALIAANLAQVKKFFYVSPAEFRLMKKYWPGALTILLRPKPEIAARALVGTTPSGRPAGDPSLEKEGTLRKSRRPLRVGVRVPAHAGARRLAAAAAAPITATSANISGQSPTKSVRKLKRDFPGILIVSGRCGQERLPSTVVEIVRNKIIIHRQGSVHV